MKRNNGDKVGAGSGFWIRLARAALVLILAATGTRAENNTSLSVSGFATNVAGLQYTGNTGTNNTLQITAGGSVTGTNSGSWTVGNSSAAHSNSVLVDNGLWICSNIITVGNSGSSNSVTVQNQGVVSNASTYIGNAAGSSGNGILVRDSGSRWVSAGSVYVGNYGARGTLTVSGGGALSVPSAGSAFYLGAFAGASNNTVTVTGSGSIISNASSVSIGDKSANNKLIVADGATFIGGWGGGSRAFCIGYDGSNNMVMVTDPGSTLSATAGVLNVGKNLGCGNSLIVSNGGCLYMTNSGLTVGYLGTNNLLLVTGSGSVFTNRSAGISVGGGGVASCSWNQMIVTNQGACVIFGDLVVGYGGSSNSVTVSGSGSICSNAGNSIWLGKTMAGTCSNTITISNGGKIYSGTAASYIGNGAAGNTFTVTDPDSMWVPTAGFTIGSGANASYNQLVIRNGGVVRHTSTSDCTIGGAGANSNSVTIDGLGSSWGGAMRNLNIGGIGTRFTLSNGGQHSDTGVGNVGMGTGASDVVVMVTDPGTIWSNSNRILLGVDTSTVCQIIVTNGGALYAGYIAIGNRANASTRNSILVTGSVNGTNSLLSTQWYGQFHGVSNRFTVVDGGRYVCTEAGNITRFGWYTGSVYNAILVSGAGSVFSNSGALSVGALGGSNNTFTVTNGGVAYLGSSSGGLSAIGSGTNASYNTLSVFGGADVKSVLSGQGVAFYVGDGGTIGNGLVVDGLGVEGSAIHTNTTTLTIGTTGGDRSNSVRIVNGGRLFLSTSLVSSPGSFNSVLVTNGALLEANTMTLSAANSVSNNGSVFQFSVPSPVITPGAFGTIVIDSGTASFRAVTNVDVRGNWTGTLANVKWAVGGTNAFRLNNATNKPAGQGYTFATGLGATNYARLELFNGSLYRGGAVTIGAGGKLVVGRGVSTIASNLTFDASATLEMDASATNGYSQLAVQGNVSLNGCTLKLTMGGNPVLSFPYMLISNAGAGVTSGSFAGGPTQPVTVNGTNYMLSITSAGGDGNDVVAVYRNTVGTIMLIR